jgi:hypothetical protein
LGVHIRFSPTRRYSRRFIAPKATSKEIPMLCQKEKNKIPFTQRNLAEMIERFRKQPVTRLARRHSRTGLNGFKSDDTHTQNIARQLFPAFYQVHGRNHG